MDYGIKTLNQKKTENFPLKIPLNSELFVPAKTYELPCNYGAWGWLVTMLLVWIVVIPLAKSIPLTCTYIRHCQL